MKCLIAATLFVFFFCGCAEWASSQEEKFIPLDDTEYPYVGLPRVVIESENFREIRDTETKIPAKLQIWGEKAPESEVLNLRIKGRGNSSFKGMPKYSIKLNFLEKQSLFGMPENKEWALIANYADKTLLKNFIVYKMSEWLGAKYAPRTKFVDLYLNRQYMGVYLLVETIKVDENRVDISEDDFLVEKTNKPDVNDIFVKTDSLKTVFVIKSKNKKDSAAVEKFREYVNDFENDLLIGNRGKIQKKLDMEDFLRFYWIQEFTKNPDGNFHRSIFFWVDNLETIHFGPVWDFDVAFGNRESYTPIDWYVRPCKWNYYVLRDPVNWSMAVDYWKKNHEIFASLSDSVASYGQRLEPLFKNNFKRWPIMEDKTSWMFKESYSSYSESIDSLNSWIIQRMKWIDESI